MIFSDICKRVRVFVVFVGFSVRQRRAFVCSLRWIIQLSPYRLTASVIVRTENRMSELNKCKELWDSFPIAMIYESITILLRY